MMAKKTLGLKYLRSSSLKQWSGGLGQKGDPPADVNIFPNQQLPGLSVPEALAAHDAMRCAQPLHDPCMHSFIDRLDTPGNARILTSASISPAIVIMVSLLCTD